MNRPHQGMLLSLALLQALTLCIAQVGQAQEDRPLTLRQAITLALRNSREVSLAQVQYDVARGEVGIDRAPFLPNPYAGTGLEYTYGFPLIEGGHAPALLEVDYLQTLFNSMWKKQQHAAEERTKNRKLELERTRDDVIVRVASIYLEIGKLRRSLELMDNEEASGEKILDVVRKLIAVDEEPAIEATRSELLRARIQQRLVRMQDRDQNLEAELRDLTAFPDGQSIQVENDEQSFADSLNANVAALRENLVTLGVKNDPGVAEAENERAARKALYRGAFLSYFPTADLAGRYGVLSKFNNYGQFYEAFQPINVEAGISITIPLFASKTAANVTLTKRQLEEAEVTLDIRRHQALVDIETKLRQLRELEADREVARLDLQVAQESQQEEQAKFDLDSATLQEIEQARLYSSDKQIALLDADFACQQAQLVLLEATGQLSKVFR